MEQNSFNAKGMKLQNKRNIMDSLRVSPCSRAELARQTGLTRAAISVIVDNLLKEGLVAEGEPIEGKVGRKSYRITLNPDRYHIIGITLERGCCCVGIAGFDGHVKCVERIEYDERTGQIDRILEDLVKIILNYEEKHAGKGQLLGIGITAPGPLNLEKGQILNPPNFEGWENIYIVDYFKKRLAAPWSWKMISMLLLLLNAIMESGECMTAIWSFSWTPELEAELYCMVSCTVERLAWGIR